MHSVNSDSYKAQRLNTENSFFQDSITSMDKKTPTIQSILQNSRSKSREKIKGDVSFDEFSSPNTREKKFSL
jgi:hypothetical protein